MHWLLLLVAVPLMFYGGSHIIKTLCLLGVNASLLQSWIPVPTIYFCGNAVSWYLSDTLAFVAIFPFILKWMLFGSKRSKILVASSTAVIYILFWIYLPQDYTHRFFYISPIFRVIDYMVGMVAGLCYLELKDKRCVKEFVSSRLIQLNLLICVCFAALIAISFANEQVVLHSVVYMPFVVVLLIIIALTGGGFCEFQFFKSSVLSVLHSFSFITCA